MKQHKDNCKGCKICGKTGELNKKPEIEFDNDDLDDHEYDYEYDYDALNTTLDSVEISDEPEEFKD